MLSDEVLTLEPCPRCKESVRLTARLVHYADSFTTAHYHSIWTMECDECRYVVAAPIHHWDTEKRSALTEAWNRSAIPSNTEARKMLDEIERRNKEGDEGLQIYYGRLEGLYAIGSIYDAQRRRIWKPTIREAWEAFEGRQR